MPKLKTFVIAGCAIAITLAALVPLTEGPRRRITYRRHQIQTGELLKSLRGKQPSDVNDKTWEAATGWAITAYHNICYSESHVPLEDMISFQKDLENKLAEDVDLATIDWIWDGLSRTSPHGQEYIEKRAVVYRHEAHGEPYE
jgi:hypothetical protein